MGGILNPACVPPLPPCRFHLHPALLCGSALRGHCLPHPQQGVVSCGAAFGFSFFCGVLVNPMFFCGHLHGLPQQSSPHGCGAVTTQCLPAAPLLTLRCRAPSPSLPLLLPVPLFHLTLRLSSHSLPLPPSCSAGSTTTSAASSACLSEASSTSTSTSAASATAASSQLHRAQLASRAARVAVQRRQRQICRRVGAEAVAGGLGPRQRKGTLMRRSAASNCARSCDACECFITPSPQCNNCMHSFAGHLMEI